LKTLKDFEEFYNTSLAADLEVLEQKRRQLVRKLLIIGAALLCAVIVVIFLVGRSQSETRVLFLFPIVAAVALVAAAALAVASKNYVAEFKSFVIGKIVRFVDEDLIYEPNSCVRQSTFVLSKIFTTEPNRYKGDDLVHGKVGATRIMFSEVNAERVTGSGRNRHRYTIFRGLFFVGDFNKNFAGQTIVIPDTAELLFGRIGQTLQSLNVFRGQLVKLEDPEFEKDFVVYGSDQIEARYILSTSLMQRMVEFRKKAQRDVYFSFVGSMVFVAISYKRGLFEPRIFRTALDFEPIREHFEDLQLAVGIVDDLNLNTRIWSKE